MSEVGHRDAASIIVGELVELRDRHRARELGHAVVEGEEVVVRFRIAVAPRLVDEELHAAREPGSDDDHHAALAGGDVLALLQAEAADRAERADGPARRWAERLRAVLDDREPLRLAELDDRVHVARVAEQVGHDHRPRAARDLAAMVSAVTL